MYDIIVPWQQLDQPLDWSNKLQQLYHVIQIHNIMYDSMYDSMYDIIYIMYDIIFNYMISLTFGQYHI